MKRVRMIKTLAPFEIPNGTEGTVKAEQGEVLRVQWDNGYFLPMYRHEVEVLTECAA